MTETLVDIALLAFGEASDANGIPDHLRRVTGREPDAVALAAEEERYRGLGGVSPLPAIIARQAAALEARLVAELAFPIRVRHGFLYAEPDVAACLGELGARERFALSLSPFGVHLGHDRYRAALDAAGAADVPLIEGWYAARGFAQSLSRRAAEALDGSDVNEWAVLFTADNVPVETALEGDPYMEQIQQTIAQLVPAIMPGDWRFGFQGARGGGEWLEPEAVDVVRQLAADGWKKLLVVPVSAVADGAATLHDLDVVVREQVEALGMEYRRCESLNDSPAFVEALADAVVDHLAHRPVEHLFQPPETPPAQG